MTLAENQHPGSAPPSPRQVQDAEQWLANLSPAAAGHLVQVWRASQDLDAKFSEVFYQRLFQAHPELVNLFPGDMQQQQQRLTNTLSEAIELVPEPDRLILLLRAAGVRHHHYQVQQNHFQLMGPILVETFKQFLGTAFSPKQEAEWLQFFTSMAVVMRSAMAQAADE
ncbi:globin domain-containing protein [Halioxenophilus sp. WMMB6]|uniref:globin domain-containing protein n=1 Tax=Halioxenophilus sp. WMMB6 TaxID=3073815 RepID=UPI00295E978D|nr:globin domain-containing protein [Halioxenophilus sp. WMMB6]